MDKRPGMIIAMMLVAALAANAGCKAKDGSVQQAQTAAEPSPAPEPAVEDTSMQAQPAEKPAAPEEKPAAEDAVQPVEQAAAGPAEAKIPADKEDLVLKLGKTTMPVVKFAHKEHAVDLQVACKTCHHPEGEARACTECHKAAPGPDKEPTFKNAAHKQCMGCHKEQKKGPTVCTKCHVG